MRKSILFFISLFIISILFPIKPANANEGVVLLKNVSGSQARFFALSTSLYRSTSFQILLQCRDLVYPVEPGGNFYVLWAKTIDPKTPLFRIGELQYGNDSFTAQNPFTGLFVTKEITESPNQPSNSKVMEGGIESIAFLNSGPTTTLAPKPTQTPVKSELTPTTVNNSVLTVTPTPKAQTKKATASLWSTLGTVAILFVILIFIFIIIIYIVNKLRNRSSGLG